MNHCIQTEGLTKRYGKKTALKDFTLAIGQGGIHAIVGSNGAGKSTLFRILLGVTTATSGIARLLGEDSRDLSPGTRGRVGYVNEEHTLPLWMKAQQITDQQRSFYPGWNQSIYEQVIGYFDVDPGQKISGLSRGERAGLNLSMALAQSPDVLILDEPTLGLDVVARQSFLEALMFTETEANTTIIYCSHQMEEIERVADQLIIMEKGTLQNNSSPDAFVERISYWIGDFANGLPAKGALPGFLTSRTIDGQHHILVADQGEEFGQVLKNNGAKAVAKAPVNLERAVNAFLTKNHNTPDSRV
ncbi:MULTISPECIES: ABC transporter ATP-binding protein [Kordiimonas]|jgi:ABC-2 type transport system ATP-binding protein|uniref:ABC-2 type transport system ATP-binding protein n=1 Tax=Kordiimonas lacus TaxID=637679 RepID=A0A1G7D7F6_9PROT|nr:MULTISPECIES: ABC transporter ATP-binding protein [Kordiimonas]SDE47574.1 ABC-2 type transport system ATP-binding protein [Kordiimonas lacus]